MVGLQPAAMAQDCLKQVFNRFCLGGPVTSIELTAEAPGTDTPLPQTAATDSLSGQSEDSPAQSGSSQYRVDDKTIIVEFNDDNKITRVSRFEIPGTWLNYTDWRSKIVRLYGRGQNLSTFPSYAASRSARLNALISGRGYARMNWPQDGWSVELIWNDTRHIELKYSLSESVGDSDTGL